MNENRIEKQIDLKSSPARVWMALTDHLEFGQWFGCAFAGAFEVGKVVPGTLNFPGFEHMTWAIEIKKMDREKLFAFSWHPYPIDKTLDYTKEPQTLVEFLLEPLGTGTRLVVVESGFDKIPANRRLEAFRMNTEGWVEQLENVAKYVG